MKSGLFFLVFSSLLWVGCAEAPRYNPPPMQSYQPPPPPPTPQKYTVIDKAFHVGAGTMSWYNWEFPVQTRLMGHFSAEGGRNDISCWVVDDDNFVNLQNNTAFRQYYESGYTTRGKVDVIVSPGTYYIVFDNRQAWFANKTVTAFFEAEYQTR